MSQGNHAQVVTISQLPPLFRLGEFIGQDGRRLQIAVTLGTMLPVIIDHSIGKAFIGCWCALVGEAKTAMPVHQEAPTCH